jgi:hypothetical protein
VDFLSQHAETAIAILALIVALHANVLSRRTKADSDRMLLSGKKRDLLQEIDRQHVTLHRVRFVLQDEILQFELCSQMTQLLLGERERIDENLKALDQLERLCLAARTRAEKIDIAHDPAQIDIEFVEIGRLTAHLQKDLEHEQSLLEGKKNLVRTAPDEFKRKAVRSPE